MKYRPEIDGLRAVAVLPVIFFHTGLSYFSGGYIGVDVFFVISGYLITTIILNDIEAGTFSIAKFYERRIRRILPALTVVLLVCLPFAYYWLMPTQLTEFSQSLIAVPLFASNILFWLKTGYFETTSELKPLLHTWSLAVEEQYYLFFPLLLIFLSRFGKRIKLATLFIILIASILLAQLRIENHPESTFYLLPSRLWEILIGSFTAFYFFYKNREKPSKDIPLVLSQTLSVLGLCFILYSIFAFDEKTPFPSFYTLAPTLGTALIILFASNKTITGKFLSNKLFVGIGLISYSAYLWHQPLFVFARIMGVNKPSIWLMFALGVLSLGLAYLTWKYIETPFRDKTRFSTKRIFQFALISSCILIAIGVLGYINKGFENRVAPNGMSYARLDSILQPSYGLDKTCESFSSITSEQCRTDSDPEILVWGDSYAMHLIPGILASNPDAKIIQMTKSSCAPILGVGIIDPEHSRSSASACIEFKEEVLNSLKNYPNIRYAVLGSSFMDYFIDRSELLVNDQITPINKDLTLSYFRTTLYTLLRLGITPVIFAPPPENGQLIGNCVVNSTFYFGASNCGLTTQNYENHSKDVIEFLREVEKEYQVIWVSDVLCDEKSCNTEMEGFFIYGNGGHLSIEGSAYLGKKMDFYKLITSK